MDKQTVDYINSRCNELFRGKVECELSASKGRILRAKRSFQQGDLIFEESPLHIVVADESNHAFLTVKRVCETSEDAAYKPIWYWAALSSLTAAELPPAVGALRPVTPEQQRQLLCLFHEPVSEASSPVEAMVRELGLPMGLALKVEELLRAWILNCFEHSEEPEGFSAYFVSSFMSHSCKPNAIWHEGLNASHVVRARLDIAQGEEICICYLSEDMLMHSAPHRKRALKKTKLFTCTCERCQPGRSVDTCRGFRCPHCGCCGLFPPLLGKALPAEELAGVRCRECGRACGDFAEGLLDAERHLRQRLQRLDEAEVSIGELLTEEDARQLQELVGDQASGALGPQHWLCERLWTHLVPWLEAKHRAAEALQLLERRVRCQRQMFPWPNATRAWTMQKYCRLLLRQYKADSSQERDYLMREVPRRFLARAEILQEEALQMLQLLFGENHRFVTRAQRKLRRVKALLERGRPRSRSVVSASEDA